LHFVDPIIWVLTAILFINSLFKASSIREPHRDFIEINISFNFSFSDSSFFYFARSYFWGNCCLINRLPFFLNFWRLQAMTILLSFFLHELILQWALRMRSTFYCFLIELSKVMVFYSSILFEVLLSRLSIRISLYIRASHLLRWSNRFLFFWKSFKILWTCQFRELLDNNFLIILLSC
jgi:hypothetical protein